jgi:lipoprotein LprG
MPSGRVKASLRRLTSWPAVAAALVALLVAGTAAACSSPSPNIPPETLLHEAKAKADSSSSAHFVLTSSNVSTSGTNILSGNGDLARPDAIQGTFNISLDGFTAKVSIVSVNGEFEALIPFATHYVKTDPSKFGLTDPAQLLDPNKGLTSLLALAQNPQKGKTVRVNGELLEQVTFTVPGSAIPVLPDAAPSEPVTLVVSINPKNFETRQISMTGPLTTAKYDSTYIVTLSNYNEHVDITMPPTS